MQFRPKPMPIKIKANMKDKITATLHGGKVVDPSSQETPCQGVSAYYIFIFSRN
jgi:hypothetical protein